MDAPREPRKIHLETSNYVLRTLETTDATGTWSAWLADPATARLVNAVPTKMSAESIRDYIGGFDRVNTHLLGIFRKEAGDLVGIRAIYINWKQAAFLVNVLIGEKESRDKGARTQTQDVLYRYLFEELSLLSAHASVLSQNARLIDNLRRTGWRHESTELLRAADGQSTVQVLHLRLPREVWRAQQTDGQPKTA